MKREQPKLLGSREASTLVPVFVLHAALVALAAGVVPHHAGGTILGGAVIGGATVAFWMIARGLLESRRSWIVGASVAKVLGYLLLVAAAFSGTVRVDALGFAVGVTCFPVAVVAGSLYAGASRRGTMGNRWSTDSPG